MSKGITDDMAWDMQVLYEAGYGLTSIASRYGISAAAVGYHLKKRGIQTRGRGSRLPFEVIRLASRRVTDKRVVAADMAARQEQTCVECGDSYSKDVWTLLCGKKRCRQQREFHNRRNDPVRYAKMRINGYAAYQRRKALKASLV